MGSPFLIVQLSDPHIGADWADADPVAGLAAAAESVRAMLPRPDALLVTGDLADHATHAEYERVGEMLAEIRMLGEAQFRRPRVCWRS
jgi:Icc protein